ncbi:MAG: hypothetical protein AB4063_01065 [Crocosphaera sp.]
MPTKLYLLKPKSKYLEKNDKNYVDDINKNPWYYTAASVMKIVVRAENEQQARELAEKKGGLESGKPYCPWFNPEYTDCEELLSEGQVGIIIQDFSES